MGSFAGSAQRVLLRGLLGLASIACSTSSEPATTSPSEVVSKPPPETTEAPPVPVKQARCNPRDAFDAPAKVMGLESVDGTARFTADELGVVFSNRTGDGLVDLFEATRPSITEPFGAAAKVAGLGGTGARMFPTLAKDDRT